MAIILENVSKTYTLGKTEVRALRQVNLTIAEGEFISIAGPSGSGKTTLLNLVGALDHPSSGRVLLDGRDLGKLEHRELAKVRLRTIGFIFQSFNLLPVLSVVENVEYPLVLLKIPAAERNRRVSSILEAVGLADRAHHRPDELSGGQRQRVAIARALASSPQIVLADEPTANLDSTTGSEILLLMEKLNREKRVTFIFASHDVRIISRAHRVVKMEDGGIIE
jgi:putative ABC transport system ATP-binding protein